MDADRITEQQARELLERREIVSITRVRDGWELGLTDGRTVTTDLEALEHAAPPPARDLPPHYWRPPRP